MEIPDPVVDSQIADEETEEMVDDVVDDVQQRLWLRAVSTSAEMLAKIDTTIMDNRVQHAVDMAIVSACERIGRLCKSDLEDILDQEAPTCND